MGDAGASGQMIALVREANGLTQKDLAVGADVSQSFVSKVERAELALDDDGLERFAKVLEVPTALLRVNETPHVLGVTCLHHRRRASKMAAATVKRIEGITKLVDLTTRRLAEGVEAPATFPLSRVLLRAGVTPDDVAAKLRADWGVAPGPIDNLTELLERAGVVIVVRKLRTDAQDAVSTWPLDGPPMILLNSGLPSDRARFTLAHELGHLLMHEMPDDEQEEQANRFAAEFLTPAELIRPELDGLTVRQFNRLATLKQRWKVSMAALIQRAAQLECISPSQFKSFRIRLNQYGWSRREPGDLPAEVPSAVRSLLDRHLEAGRTEEQLAELALMLPDQFRRHYLETTASPRPAATSTNEGP